MNNPTSKHFMITKYPIFASLLIAGLFSHVGSADDSFLFNDPPTEEPVPTAPPPSDDPSQNFPPRTEVKQEKTNTKTIDDLPPIEAKHYPVTPAQMSLSQRVYLFDDSEDQRPKPGKIILLRQDSEQGLNVMAFRILRNYEDRNQFAAAIVRKYKQQQKLNLKQTYFAVQKLKDLFTYHPSEKERHLDERDLKELESKMAPLPKTSRYDPELDAGSSPPPSDYDGDDSLEDELDDLSDVVVDDVVSFDPDRHWLSAQTGFFRNLGPDGTSINLLGGGLRYAFSLGQMVFLNSKKIQDSVALEMGAFLYHLSVYQSDVDSFTVLPVAGTVRYNLLFGPGFAFFVYLGITKNFVLSANQATDEAIDQLASTLPSGGVGFLFRIGPKWHLRCDLGVDNLVAGLVLRF